MSEKLSSLARVLRPKTLDEYKGNASIKANLKSSILGKPETRPQTIMLNGRAGNGKTTLARLIAKSYACTGRTKDQFTCEECASCKAFNVFVETGDHQHIPNITEVNCADKTGIADMAAITQTAYAPSFVRGWRIWILDESHRLSTAAQSHLLKFTEEPPENVLFIFATTDPDEVVDTLRSRMNLTYEVNLERKEITSVLAEVCESEGITYQTKALGLITSRSEGILRKALNNLEAVISSGDPVTVKSVSDLYGDVDIHKVQQLFQAYSQVNVTKFIQILNDLEQNYPAEKIQEMSLYVLKIGISIQNGIIIEDLMDSDIDLFTEIFGAYSSAELLNLFKLVVHTRHRDVTLALMQAVLEKAEGYYDMPTDPSALIENKKIIKEEEGLKQEYKQELRTRQAERESEAIEDLYKTVEIEI